ncbi:5-formyltetrahydrofolate cyclo-ligase [Natronobacterium gregoryi]|uniref:5-formyltetrahydrofolate cyclo-ligase n=2 Tax=Natronobacterium gregoryi TaxID=44930 RepID=L0AEI3_NATGS|nr:5-formyltetrahydrofolate cyclo-ligase [Natronobacterium gregoryi]AFZ72236.1 5-formyltetrahydrofolate cyclo-ligase [Natronobacterium gregoryi SP2]ELY62364.1 5-formyltetrahydrofolate cyclo-ligase [Natronobacterium gregoryi SP2]PLK20183.1 5-formyltetrahydrofolate cyclo-ligase [Natronobacterium gregoryi SP2]SFJ28665.1 5-formyltetrahydrofolate cyclo-ligase [Natronobacterium gregoryi]
MDKQALRERIWNDLEERGIARFPFPPHGRIPNFAGASEAAARLTDQPEWIGAATIKANPDAPQLPVRRAALRAGKTVYMAVPRLADEQCFLRLDPDELEDYDAATTVSGSDEYGTRVAPADVESIDLIVSGSVAVTEDGDRVGKGEGYSDLEYAILRELALVDDETTVATTIHERQLVGPDDEATAAAHDVSMDLIVTPEAARRPAGGEQPSGIDWKRLEDERLEEMPVLQRLDE